MGKSAQIQCYPGALGLGLCPAPGRAWHSPPCCLSGHPAAALRPRQLVSPRASNDSSLLSRAGRGCLAASLGFACWNERRRRRAGVPAGRRDRHRSPGDTWPTHCIRSLPFPSSCLGWTGAARPEMAALQATRPRALVRGRGYCRHAGDEGGTSGPFVGWRELGDSSGMGGGTVAQ